MSTPLSFRQKIADFFDRVSPAVLIPSVFLSALLLAGGLIWAGIKLSPIVVKDSSEEDRIPIKRNTMSSGGEDFSNSNDNFEDDLFTPKETGVDSNGNQKNYYDGGESQSGSDQISGGENGGDQSPLAGDSGGTNDTTTTENYQGGDSHISDQSASSDLGGGEDNISSNNNREIYNGGTPRANSNQNSYLVGLGGCHYPSGDVSIWWHSATKKQQDCYVGKNGQPDLYRPPYFCPYENNEDCYYR